jgi:hypothetical protein
MLELIKNLSVQIEQGVQKYFPMYMEWLTGKLDSDNAFGTLAIVGVVTFMGLFIYLHIRNNLA